MYSYNYFTTSYRERFHFFYGNSESGSKIAAEEYKVFASPDITDLYIDNMS